MSPTRYIYIFIAVSALIDITSFLVYTNSPSSSMVRDLFLNEDSLVENLTAAFYLFSSLLALYFVLTDKTGNAFKRRWLILVSAVGATGLLEEISFGERIFDLEMPVIAGTKIDALHDLFGLGLSHRDLLTSDHLLPALLVLITGAITQRPVNQRPPAASTACPDNCCRPVATGNP